MRASAEKFIAYVREDQRRPSEWVAIITWRIGFRGPFLVRGNNKSEVRAKLARLDATVRFDEHCAARNRGGNQ